MRIYMLKIQESFPINKNNCPVIFLQEEIPQPSL